MNNKTKSKFNTPEIKWMGWYTLVSAIANLVVMSAASSLGWGFAASCYAMLGAWIAISLPCFLFAKNRLWKKASAEKQDVQNKQDAEDQAMFGKPLRDFDNQQSLPRSSSM